MDDLFFQFGRRLGHAAIPAARKTRWAWRLFTGSEQESIAAEREMGEAMAREVPRLAPSAGNLSDTAMLGDVCRYLAAHLRSKDREFSVSVVQSGAPNAFSLPGGFIFVDITLLELCRRDEGQLAFLLAHEIAHIVLRHAMDRWVTTLGVNVISMLLTRGGLGAWWQEKGKQLLHNAYSRDQETEADEFAYRLARAAGYDPEGAVRLLQVLERLRGTSAGLGEHLASHPPEAKRLAALENVQRKLEAKGRT